MEINLDESSPDTLDGDSYDEGLNKRPRTDGGFRLTTAATVTERGISIISAGPSRNQEIISLDDDDDDVQQNREIFSIDTPETSRFRDIVVLDSSPQVLNGDDDDDASYTESFQSENSFLDNPGVRVQRSNRHREVIDLTSSDNEASGYDGNEDGTDADDDDVIMVSEFQRIAPPPDIPRPPPGALPATARNTTELQLLEFCFGTLRNCTMRAQYIPRPIQNPRETTGPMWPEIPLALIRSGTQTNMVVQVQEASGQIIGTVEGDERRLLWNLMWLKRIQLQTRAYPRPKLSNEIPGARIDGIPGGLTLGFFVNVNGPESTRKSVGDMVRAFGRTLQLPYMHQSTLPYRNAHNDSSSSPQMVVRPGPIQKNQTAEILEDISCLFDKLSSAKDLPEMEADHRVKTPLIKHQKQGLAFLTLREKIQDEEAVEDESHSLWRKTENSEGKVFYQHVITRQKRDQKPAEVRGGILADMMGLGKTLQILSLVMSTKEESEAYAARIPHRDPESMVECHAKTTLLICPLSTISNWEEQIIAHLRLDSIKSYIFHGQHRITNPYDLAAYDTVITTYSVVASEFRKNKQTDGKYVSPLQKMKFFRIVLDEAHIIREAGRQQSQAVLSLDAERRWAVTGTPIQNRLEDFAALLRFLRMDPFSDKTMFSHYINNPFKRGDSDVVPRLQLIVNSLTLRRLKDRIDLPPREDKIVSLEFSPKEREIYEATAKQSKARVELLDSASNTGGKKYIHILQMILRMRLICAHGRELLGDDELADMKGLTASDAIDLEAGGADERPTLSKRQAYEILTLMKEAGEDNCTLCRTKITTTAEVEAAAIDELEVEVSVEPEDIPTGAKRKRKPESKPAIPDRTLGFLTPCAHLLCEACVPKYSEQIDVNFVPGMRASCPICQLWNRIVFVELKSDEMKEHENGTFNKNKKKNVPYSGQSTKVKHLIRDLMKNREESAGQERIKSVVFSGWTSHMDLIAVAFRQEGVRFVRLDGSMSRPMRAGVIKTFREDPEVEVILVSIMAGGLGLNLTTACRAYVMEPQFNPAAEAQAIDRIHRLGQKRPVVCVRYIMKDSFEERIVELQNKKNDLASMTLSNKKLTKAEGLAQRLENLRSLFR